MHRLKQLRARASMMTHSKSAQADAGRSLSECKVQAETAPHEARAEMAVSVKTFMFCTPRQLEEEQAETAPLQGTTILHSNTALELPPRYGPISARPKGAPRRKAPSPINFHSIGGCLKPIR